MDREVIALFCLLGLDNPHGPSINEQGVVSRSLRCLQFTDRHPERYKDIHLVLGLNVPTRLTQQIVYPITGFLLWMLVLFVHELRDFGFQPG